MGSPRAPESTASSVLHSSVWWAAFAGVYAFVCSSLLLLGLSPVTTTLAKLLRLPSGVAPFLLAAPVTVIGAVVWWAGVERPDARTYLRGAVAGLLTAVVAVLFWLSVYSFVWTPELVLTAWVVVLFVVAVSAPVAIVAMTAFVYLRRRVPTTGAQT